tara:strand:+ start:41 stop:1348 length:1308 start_codon:yes stop_codon:yes gene_type:complete
MILNRIDLGTQCTVRSTGKKGILKKIYFYPTKFEIEFSDGFIEHYKSKDLEFDGITQPQAKLKISPIPDNGIGEQWSVWRPFQGESVVKHHFNTSKEIIWEMLTSLDMYNIWFFGIQRSLPIIEIERYVHRYSFIHFELKPGSYFKIRPKTVAPYFKCRINSVEKEKKFGFNFRNTPFTSEDIEFKIKESDNGVWVTCQRKSSGLLSFINNLNWSAKSLILQKLDSIVPKIDLNSEPESLDDDDSANHNGGFLTRQDYIDYAINMGMEGNLDFVNGILEKPIRGMAKAGIVKSKRTGVIPPKPDIPTKGNLSQASNQAKSGLSSLSNNDIISYLVNKALDGDMDTVNNHNDKVQRGKAKAMIVKINRGAIERPPMPEISESSNLTTESTETDDQIMERLIAKGLDGDMDEINNLTNRVLRGKIKAAIVKAKRQKK